jgi:hypothetical protein
MHVCINACTCTHIRTLHACFFILPVLVHIFMYMHIWTDICMPVLNTLAFKKMCGFLQFSVTFPFFLCAAWLWLIHMGMPQTNILRDACIFQRARLLASPRYVCMYVGVCMYVCMYISPRGLVYWRRQGMCACMCVCACACVRARARVYLSILQRACLSSVDAYVCMYVYVCACVFRLLSGPQGGMCMYVSARWLLGQRHQCIYVHLW